MGFGVLFLGLVWSKKRKHRKLIARIEHEDFNHESSNFGIQQHYGLFYAMGWALIFEGLLSACYHVCPTDENFQFDTTFMYVIAILCFIKIYQFRHPDVASNAYKVFLGVGVVMLLEVFGIFYESTLFWTSLLLMYFLAAMLLSIIIYQAGKLSFRPRVLRDMLSKIIKDLYPCNSAHISTKRLAFVLILELVNIMFLIYGTISQPNISMFLLMIFIGNLLVYTIYYTAMKAYHKEPIRSAPIIYSLLALLCWAPALYFFLDARTNSENTPAESRNYNEKCVIFDFYDNHDIWHIFSAGGLFFSFMMLLTLDDGLFYTPRHNIHVF